MYREDAVLQRLGAVARLKLAFEPDRYARIKDASLQVKETFRAIVRDAITAGEVSAALDPDIAGDLLSSLIMSGIAGVTDDRPTRGDFDALATAFAEFIGATTTCERQTQHRHPR
ncbi:MAG: hypothetical protein Pars93KO_27720 [Parasphingorhabdus sp.]